MHVAKANNPSAIDVSNLKPAARANGMLIFSIVYETAMLPCGACDSTHKMHVRPSRQIDIGLILSLQVITLPDSCAKGIDMGKREKKSPPRKASAGASRRDAREMEYLRIILSAPPDEIGPQLSRAVESHLGARKPSASLLPGPAPVASGGRARPRKPSR